MSAHDHIQPRQLEMFLPAKKVIAQHDLGDRHSGETKDATMLRKASEAMEYGLDKSVAKEGVKKPIAIYHYPGTEGAEVYNGHHRLSVASPNAEIPLEHFDAANDRGMRPDEGRDTWQHHKTAQALSKKSASKRRQQEAKACGCGGGCGKH